MKLSALLLAVTAIIATFTLPSTAFAGNNIAWSISFSNGYYPQQRAWTRPNATIVISNAPRIINRHPVAYPHRRIANRMMRPPYRPVRHQRFYYHRR